VRSNFHPHQRLNIWRAPPDVERDATGAAASFPNYAPIILLARDLLDRRQNLIKDVALICSGERENEIKERERGEELMIKPQGRSLYCLHMCTYIYSLYLQYIYRTCMHGACSWCLVQCRKI